MKILSFVSIFAILTLALAASAWGQSNAAQPPSLSMLELAQLTSSDGVSLNQLGNSVSISGNTVVVGAPTAGGPYSLGAVYVFVKSRGGWSNMTQIAKLTASDGSANDYLGWSVSIVGDTVVAGAPTDLTTGIGSVYVFVKPDGGWADMTETAKLTASDAQVEAEFGVSVAVESGGGTIVIGADEATVGSNSRQGEAYVFNKPAGGWVNATESQKLIDLSGQAGDNFGRSVAVSGNAIAVGSSGRHFYQGAICMFVNGRPVGQLTASDGRVGDELGISLSMSGNTIVAGAPYAPTTIMNVGEGRVYVYDQPAEGWATMTQNAELLPDFQGQLFGWSVAIAGNTIVAGGPNNFYAFSEPGKAYGYVRQAIGWHNTVYPTYTLKSPITENDNFFGISVAVSGNTVVSGAVYPTRAGQGAAFVFGP